MENNPPLIANDAMNEAAREYDTRRGGWFGGYDSGGWLIMIICGGTRVGWWMVVVLVVAVAVVVPGCAVAASANAVAASANAGAGDDDAAAPAKLMVLADLNHDGIADRVEVMDAGAGMGAVEVELGRAGGGFGAVAARVLVGHSLTAMVVGDFNHDGKMDVMVGDEDGRVRVLAGDGKGGLGTPAEVARVQSVVSIAVADFNHDGVLDVAVSDWRASAVVVLMGSGDGRFQRGWSFPLRLAGLSPRVTVADYNHDGVPDLTVVYEDDDGYTFDVMLGNGNGLFTAAPTLSLLKDANAACVPEQQQASQR